MNDHEDDPPDEGLRPDLPKGPDQDLRYTVEPRAYLADVISRIVNGHPQSRFDELLPWAYPTTPAVKAAA